MPDTIQTDSQQSILNADTCFYDASYRHAIFAVKNKTSVNQKLLFKKENNLNFTIFNKNVLLKNKQEF